MYKLLYDNPTEDIFARLMKIRNIDENPQDFLNPSFAKYRINPDRLTGMKKTLDRIQKAISDRQKIMIFGDYDVDGITSSFLIYSFITKFLGYKNISIRLPNRISDGYGIKKYHIDEIAKLGVSLIITVDNGITAVDEIAYANDRGIDVIITDHHTPLEQTPKAFSIINPHVSGKYPFKGLAGVGVAFKLITAMANQHIDDDTTKQKIMNYYLPIVALGTVGDCVPLVGENRLLVKKGLEIINKGKGIPRSLHNFIKYLNIKNQIDTFHIGFMMAPRLNAGGRMVDPYDSLSCLMCQNASAQRKYLDKIEKMNNDRKELQDSLFKQAETMMDQNKHVLVAYSKDFHEGIIGLIAGKMTEKYYKPCVIMHVNKKEGIVTGSVRGPEYYDVVDWLNQVGDYMLNYGGHKQAGGMTFKIEHLDKVVKILEKYGQQTIKPKQLKKVIKVDTPIYDHELNKSKMADIDKLAPFGEANPQPIFLLKDVAFTKAEKVGKNGNGHLKLYARKGDNQFNVLFWGKGLEVDKADLHNPKTIIGKVRKDDYNGGFYIDGNMIV